MKLNLNKTIKFMATCFIAIALSSCSTYVKLVEVEAGNGKKDSDKNILFENDTVRVEYNLWGAGGRMNYRVYNKLNVPLYINWFKSSYIKWDTKYSYTGDHRDLSFIPPRAYVENPVSYILLREQSSATYASTSKSGKRIKIENVDIRNDKNATKESVAKTWTKSGKTTVYSKTYDKTSTPLAFRNFITVSTCESADECNNAKNLIFINNDFFVKKMTEMKTKQFNGKGTKAKTYVKRGTKMVKVTTIIWSYPYTSGDSFYIPLSF